jgi:hypothetical protein
MVPYRHLYKPAFFTMSDIGNHVKAQAHSGAVSITHASPHRSSEHLPASFDRLSALSERLNL